MLNYANNDTVNGPAVGSTPGLGAPIVAFPAGEANSSTGASKLAVGIVFALPAYLAGELTWCNACQVESHDWIF